MAKSIESLYSVPVHDIKDYKKALDLALQQVNEIDRNLWDYEYSQITMGTYII